MIAAALLLLLQDPLSVAPDTVKRVHDAVHYDVLIAVSDTGKHIVGEVETTWILKSSDPVVVPLDSAMRVVRVLMDGRENTRLFRTRYGRQGSIVYIPHEKKAGDTLKTRIRYHGVPRDGLVIRIGEDGKRTIFADNWPDRAHLWLPVQDHPSDKATVSWRVEVPISDRVIANGNLVKVDTLAHDRTAWQYRLDVPIPVSNFVIGVAEMAVTQLTGPDCTAPCIPQASWTYKADSAYGAKAFARAPDMMAYFQKTIGPFPYPSLAHVQTSTRFGGMENATAIFYADGMYRNQNVGEEIIAHEMAHQWYGDAVTEADWHHLWLSEGFATYLAALWLSEAHGDSVFRAKMQSHARNVMFKGKSDSLNPVTERPIVDPEATDLMGLLSTNNYPKGAWVLHQLRGVVGDSAFFKGMRTFYERYRNGIALSSDFETVMEEASGQDLGWYFREALTLPGYPMLTVRWKHSGGRLQGEVVQVQPDMWGLRRIPGLELDTGSEIVKVDVSGATTKFDVKVKKAPSRIVVDPNGRWLVRAKMERS